MATLNNTRISDTYFGLIKTIDNAVISATLKQLTDGSGNATGLYINNAGDFKVNSVLEFGSLKDTGENIVITKFVDQADGIANNNNDTSIPTSKAVKDYVDTHVTAQDLDFRGDDNTVFGDVDLDSESFQILGTANEIESAVVSAGGTQLRIGIVTNPTLSGNVTITGDLNISQGEIINIGSNFDLYATASGEYIQYGTNPVIFNGNADVIFRKQGSEEKTAVFTPQGSAKLYHNNNLKLETTVNGLNVTGKISNLTDPTANQDAATKAYVDSLDAGSDLDFGGDSGTGDVNLNTQTFLVSGTTNQITTSATNQELTLSLPSTVHRNLQGNVTGNLTGNVTGDVTGNITGIGTLSDGSTAVTQATSDNSTKIATTAFVKSLDNASDLDFSGDSGTGDVTLNTQTFSIIGTANEVETSASNQQLQIGLPSSINVNSASATILQTARDISLTGEASATISSFNGSSNVSGAVTLDNNSVTGKVLTGLASPTASNILASDTILEAFGKTQSQLNTLAGGLRFMGTWNANTNTPTLQSGGGEADSGTTTGTTANKLIDSSQNFTSTVTNGDKVINQASGATALVTNVDSNTSLTLDADIMVSGQEYTIDNSPFITQGHYFVVSVGGTSSLNGLSNWAVGDWVIAGAGNVWEKLDHTQVDGTGTAGNIAKFSSTNVIADSIMAESGSTITLTGGLTATQNLSIGGTSALNGDITVGDTSSAFIGMARAGANYLAATNASGELVFRTAGSTPALTLDVNQNATFASAVWIPDYIYHVGDANSYFGYSANDQFILRTNASTQLFADSTNTYLYFDGTQKLRTASEGIVITGSVQSTLAIDNSTLPDVPSEHVILLNPPITTGYYGGGISWSEGTNTAASLGVYDDGSGGALGLYFATGTNASIKERMTIDKNGLVTIGALTSGETGRFIVNDEGGSTAVAKFASRTNRAIVQVSDNDTTGYLSAEGGIFSVGRAAGANNNNINIESGGQVGFGTQAPNHRVDIYSEESVGLRIHRPNSSLDSSEPNGIGFSTRSDGTTSSTDTRSGIFSYYNGNLFFSTNTSDITADPYASRRLEISSAGVVTIKGSLGITADGSNAVTFTESGNGLLTIATPDDFVVDCASDIVLDAAGNDIRFRKNGVEYGKFKQDSSNFAIYSSVENKDIIFRGNDGGTTIDALTLDMSNGGSATFRDDIDLAGNLNLTGSSKVIRLNSGGLIDFDTTNLQFNTQRDPNTGGFHNTAKSHAHIGLQGANGGSQIIFGTADANNTVATTRMTIRSDGNIGIGNAGYASSRLAIDSSTNDDAIYATSSDQNCFATFRDNGSTANIAYGARGNDHILRKDNADYFVVNNVGDVYNYESVNRANTMYGYAAGTYGVSGGSGNSFFGYNTANNISSASNNTFMGRDVCVTTLTGNSNTSIGMASSNQLTSGIDNVALGVEASNKNATGNRNIAIGNGALYSNTANSNIVAIGHQALYTDASPEESVAVGYNALRNQTSGRNHAFGYYALLDLTTGNYNVAVGGETAENLTEGNYNTAVGTFALRNETTGSENTAVGYQSQASSTTQNSNTSLGYRSMYYWNSGNENICIGYHSGYSTAGASTAAECIFIGSQAGGNGTAITGNHNTIIGRYAAYMLTSGQRNTMLGHQSGVNITTGNNNTFVGKSSGDSVSTGSHNTFVGQAAGDEGTTGDYNICIGHGSGSGSSPFHLTTESGRVVIGDNSIGNAYIKVAWTVTSDKRDKTDFGEVPHGLDFVSKLKPTSYKFKKDRNSEESKGRERYGFLAQDILELEKENPVIIDNENVDSLKYNEASLIPVLVNAIQELKAEVDSLKKQCNCK